MASARAARSTFSPPRRLGVLACPWRIAAIAGLAFAAAAACDRADSPGGRRGSPSSAAAEGPPAPGGQAICATLVDVESWNPVFARSTFSNDVARRLFLPLLVEQPDFADHPPSYEPGLALAHESSADGLAITFRLRPDAVWSDGHPVTARDVAFTHEALTSPAVAWPGASVKARIVSVAATDDLTVTFRFSEETPANLRDANEGLVLPAHAFSKVPFSEWRTHDFSAGLVTSGPFRLASWKKNEEIVLERNPRYHGAPKPWLDRVVFRVLANQGQTVDHLLGGHVDVIEAVSPDAVERIRRSGRAAIVEYANRQIDHVAWNEIEPGAFTRLKKSLEAEGKKPAAADLARLRAESPHPLFGDADVRRALSLAIDRRDIVESLWLSFADPSLGPVHSSLWACDRTLPPYPYDPERAKEILRAEGFADSDGDGILDRGGVPFSFALATNVENKLRERIALKIRDQLRRVGADVRFDAYDDATVRQMVNEKRFDARLGAWRVSTKPELRSSYHTASGLSGQNVVSYSNPRLDELIERIERTKSPAEAQPLWREAQRLVRDDEPYALLYEPRRINAVSTKLRGLGMNALETYFRLEDWWIPAALRAER